MFEKLLLFPFVHCCMHFSQVVLVFGLVYLGTYHFKKIFSKIKWQYLATQETKKFSKWKFDLTAITFRSSFLFEGD